MKFPNNEAIKDVEFYILSSGKEETVEFILQLIMAKKHF